MKKEQISMMDEMNRQLNIAPGKVYWMDWERTRNEETQTMKVTVETIYPHAIIVMDKHGRRIGIPAESAALDLRKTKKRKRPDPSKQPAPERPPLNREEIIKGHLAGKSGRQIAREVGWSDVSVNRIIREWKQKQGA